jgi:hypothetical protein
MPTRCRQHRGHNAIELGDNIDRTGTQQFPPCNEGGYNSRRGKKAFA